MEEAKAAAYYEELTRKGEGAARFKQGLGFSSQSSNATTTNNPPAKGSSFSSSSSSFLSSFVKASSPGRASELQKQIELENIQKKLQKKKISENQSRVLDNHSRDESKYNSKRSRRRSSSRERDRPSNRKSRSRSRDGHNSRHRYRSSSREERDRERRIETGRRRRSKSPSSSGGEGSRRRRSRERKSRGRSRSLSPRDRRLEKSRGNGYKDRGEGKSDKEKTAGMDYSRLINGYEEMTPAEKVKAKMKLQLSQTVEKDTVNGMGAGWERFEFNKDAPLDDEEIEAAEDDVAVVKNMGQSFRFSAVEARREEEIKAAHDKAMFGVSALPAPPPILIDNEPTNDTDRKESNDNGLHSNLMSNKVLAKQQGSWRDRARKLQDESKS